MYIIVDDTLLLDSVTRARKISRELYNIKRPVAIQSEHEADNNMFLVLVHPDGKKAAMSIRVDMTIDVHPQADISRLTALFPDLTADERFMLESYVLTAGEFPFGAIIPSNTEKRTEEYLRSQGWFENIDVK